MQKLYCYVVIFPSSGPDKIIMTYHQVYRILKVLFIFVFSNSFFVYYQFNQGNYLQSQYKLYYDRNDSKWLLIEEEELFCEWNTHWKGNTKSGKVETLFFIDTALHRDWESAVEEKQQLIKNCRNSRAGLAVAPSWTVFVSYWNLLLVYLSLFAIVCLQSRWMSPLCEDLLFHDINTK